MRGKLVQQVDLPRLEPLERWFLVGFWGGDLGVVSKDLEYLEFFKMKSSGSFNINIYLVGDSRSGERTGLDC